jgi:hypothetical protein
LLVKRIGVGETEEDFYFFLSPLISSSLSILIPKSWDHMKLAGGRGSKDEDPGLNTDSDFIRSTFQSSSSQL